MADAWTVEGVELPEAFDFPITTLGTTSDIHGEGVAPRAPGVLEDDDLRVFLVGGHRINADWLKARWPVMAATDLYERGREAADADIEFLLLMMSMEALFTTDGMRGVRDRLSKRCALLNGRDFGERETIRDTVRALYKRRSWLVHGNLFDAEGFLDMPRRDTLTATGLVRLSLLRLIALGGQMKTDTMASLDRADSDPRIADSVHAQVNSYWEKFGVARGVFDMRVGQNT